MMLAAAWLLVLIGAAHAQIIQTVAGTDWILPGGGRPAVEIPLSQVRNVLVAPNGDILAADPGNNAVVKIDARGILTIVAGNGLRGFSGDGGPATGARITAPTAIVLDRAGNLYISDAGTRIRKVTPNGIITTIAGTGNTVAAGDGGPAIRASLTSVQAMAFDAADNLYLVDAGHNTARRIRPNGIIERVAGTGQAGFSGDNGPATSAELRQPSGAAVDARGVLYISDSGNHRVRQVAADGTISTFAGTGTLGFAGDNGPAIQARLNFLNALAIDAAGNLLIADSGNSRIRRVTPDGVITTVAGNGQLGLTGDGGLARNATIRTPQGIAADAGGGLVIGDTGNSRVRKVTAGGIISTVGGNGEFRAIPENSSALNAFLFEPRGIAFDSAGNLFVAEIRGHTVRKISPEGLVTRFAGSGRSGGGGDGGKAVDALLNFPRSLTLDGGNMYIPEASGHRVRRVAPDGIITTVAGGNGLGFSGDGGPATQATLNSPAALAFDAARNMYVADSNNHRIRRVALDGTITTFAGSGPAGLGNGAFGGDDGPATSGRLNTPRGLAFDSAGNLYISDSSNHRIRRVTPGGVISTFAGRGNAAYSGDGGAATAAELAGPESLLIDAGGNLYIADTNNHRIRRVTPGGTISTVAGGGAPGFPNGGFGGDGGPPLNARFNLPAGVALDPANNLYIADSGNDRVRAVLPTVPSFNDPGAPLLTFSGRSAGPRTAPQSLNLSASITGVPFSVEVQATGGGSWLSVTPATGAMPARIEVIADPSALAPGSYEATLTITAPIANPTVRRVVVRLTVGPPDLGRVAASPDEFSFAFNRGAFPETRALQVSNRGGGTLNFSAAATTNAGGSWLTVSPGGGSATPGRSAALTVRASPAGLAAGTYTGNITLTNATSNETVTVAVAMTVTQIEQTILLSQSGLTFTAVAGGGMALPHTFGVLNIGRGVMSWTATASTLPGGGSWLSVAPSQGSSDVAPAAVPLVEVRVDSRGLEPGEYHGRVRVESEGAANSPQDVSIVLEVLPPGTDPGPVVRPAGLIFSGVSGGESPSSQDVQVYNLTAASAAYASNAFTFDGANWLSLAPPRATVDPTAPTRIVVQPESSGLAPGIREGLITLLFPGLRSRSVSVLFVLAPGAGAQPSIARAAQVHHADCAPTRLLPVFTSFGSDFTVPTSWPTPVEVRVADDCGGVMAAGSAVVTFSNGDPPLPLIALGGGRWSGTWQARNAQSSQVILTATAEAGGVRGSAQISGALRANPSPPVVGSGAVVSAASLTARVPLAPGSMISIFGTRLADGVDVATVLPLETRLANATVTLAGRPLPLLFASEGQINAMIPYGIAVNTRQQLIVRRGGSYTVPEGINVAPAMPGVFAKDQTGRGQGVILDGQFRFVEPGNPTRAGDAIVIYCSGLGDVDPPVAAGSAAPSSPLSVVKDVVTVTIGGVEAQLLFAGLAPRFAGLYQVNVFVPAGVTPGDAVPVVITVAGQSSPPVTIAVR